MLVISDTHGKISKAYEVAQRIHDLDLLVHLGDYERDAEELSRLLEIRSVAVRGNRDGAVRHQESSRVWETEYGKIYLTHGHLDGVRSGNTAGLLERCREYGCRAAFFGHTHVAYFDEADGVTLLNPGSLSLPRDGSSGTYAIVQTSKERLDCSVLYYHRPGEPPRRKPHGGYLRNLMNQSDRL